MVPGPHDAGAGRAFGRDQRVARVAFLVDGAAAAGLEIVVARVARREDDGVRVDDERDAALERDWTERNARFVPLALSTTALPASASVECELECACVSSFVSSCSASVVSATGVSSAVSVAHAAGNFGSMTVRVS